MDGAVGHLRQRLIVGHEGLIKQQIGGHAL